MTPLALFEPVDWDLVAKSPRTGGVSAATHRSAHAAAAEFVREFPAARVCLSRGFGVALGADAKTGRPDAQWQVGLSAAVPGADVRCSVYGPQQADVELDLVEGKRVSDFVFDLWEKLAPAYYIGPPSRGMMVTSYTEAGNFLRKCVKGTGVFLDVLTECAGESGGSWLAAYCRMKGVPVYGEPHGYNRLQWSRSALLDGCASVWQRVDLALAGNAGPDDFALHPKKNFAILNGSVSPGDRVIKALGYMSRGVTPIVEPGGLSAEQRRAVFGSPVATGDDSATGDAAS